jgi:hypothetical protein
MQALDDPSVKSKVADTIAWVLQEKYVIQFFFLSVADLNYTGML